MFWENVAIIQKHAIETVLVAAFQETLLLFGLLRRFLENVAKDSLFSYASKTSRNIPLIVANLKTS